MKQDRLFDAIEDHDTDAVRKELARCDLRRIRPRDGRMPLDCAVEIGSLEIARLLLDAGADPDGDAYGQGRPLLAALDRRDPDLVHLLLEAGADPHGPLFGGERPLLLMANGGSLAMVELLLHAGADPLAEDAEGHNALDHAALWGREGALEALAKRCPPEALARAQAKAEGFRRMVAGPPRFSYDGRRLIAAIEADDPAAVQRELDQGIDIEALSEHGETPLTVAARLGRLEILKLLLERGADPNHDGEAHPPVVVAQDSPVAEQVLRLLVAAGAEPHREQER